MPDETKIKCALIAACTVACVRGEEDLPRGNDIFSLPFSDDNSPLLNELHRIYAVVITFATRLRKKILIIRKLSKINPFKIPGLLLPIIILIYSF